MFEITLFRFIFDTFCVYRFLLRLYSSRIDRTQFLIFFGSRTIRVFCFETQQISFLANWIGSSTNDDSQLLRKVRTLYLWKLYLRRMFIVRKEIRLHFIITFHYMWKNMWNHWFWMIIYWIIAEKNYYCEFDRKILCKLN